MSGWAFAAAANSGAGSNWRVSCSSADSALSCVAGSVTASSLGRQSRLGCVGTLREVKRRPGKRADRNVPTHPSRDCRPKELAVTEPATHDSALSALLHETRQFEPAPELAAAANAQPDIYARAAADPLGFWDQEARELTWTQPWEQVLEWEPPFAKWFVGGKLNVSVNCVDRHVEAGRGDKVAFYWEGEPEGDRRTVTYADLHREVCQAANALTELGVKTGDRVAVYMPMIPETAVAMLACARIGAPHSLVFGGFSAEALAGRIIDADARFVITADGGYRRGAPNALKPVSYTHLRAH